MASTISAGTTTTTSLVYTADTSGVLQLQTNGTTTAVTIDTAQNVGIGVTPSAWTLGANTRALQFVYGSVSTSTNNITMVQNGYYNGSNWIYLYNNSSTLYNQGSGAHVWFNAPSGTAGNPISGANAFVQAMTLDNSGNLLVGSTTAYAKFQVYQASNAYAGFIYQQYATSSSTSNAAMQVRNDYVTGSNTGYMIVFQNGNATYSGSITSTTTATAYNTTSDRRLKTNIVDLTNSGTVIDSLKPRAFTWIADSSADAGFIADEFQQVLPKAVTGQPNATKEEDMK